MRQFLYIPIVIFLAVVVILPGCEDILEKDISRENIILVGPADSVVSSDTLQKFAWEHIGPVADYQLQVVTPSFTRIETLVTDTITPYNLVELSLRAGRQYQWRVRALNGSSASVYTTPRTFTIKQ
jgi:uncharacterized protein YceK